MRFAGLTAIVLHVRAYRETSAIVQFFTLEEGRLTGVVRGMRRGKHPQRVEPFGFGEVSLSGRSDLMTVTNLDLKDAFALEGDALSGGFYVLEVLSRVLGERQPEPVVFASTRDTLQGLSSLGSTGSAQAMAVYLRAFEATLLETLGYGIDFMTEAETGAAIQADGTYRFDGGVGFTRVAEGTVAPGKNPLAAISGRVIKAVALRDFSTVESRRCARLIFAQALAPMLGSKPLVSRSLWRGASEGGEGGEGAQMVMSRRKLPTEVVIEVQALGSDGLGRGQYGERAISVRNALPGELVTTRILKRRRGRLLGDGIGVEKPHSDRRVSACPHFPRCGGCSHHHIDYPAQLAQKTQILAAHLERVGMAPQQWLAPVSTGRLHYRRKARLGVRLVGERVLVGFRESFSNRVADLGRCVTLTPEIGRLLQPLGSAITEMSIRDKVPQIEVAQGESGERRSAPTLIVRHLAPFSESDLAMWGGFERAHDVQIVLQAGGYDTLVTLRGEAPSLLHYDVPASGLHLAFRPEQFIQVNLRANREMIRQALCLLGSVRDRQLVDLFCGNGNFSLPFARAGAGVVGFEAAEDAVTMARHNAGRNQVAAKFAVADLYRDEFDPAGELAGALRGADVLVLDPPRSGAGPQLATWLQTFGGATVLYVSCSPETFADDALTLKAADLQLTKVGIFDMFPNTAHVETMGLFTRG